MKGRTIKMTKRFSLAHLTVLEYSPAEMTYMAAKTGYDYVSFRTIPLGTVNEPQYPLAGKKEILRETKQALQNTGIELLDIEMVRIYDGVNPKIYEPDFEAAAELGGKHVLTTVLTNNRPFAVECFAEICELAKPYGLTIDLEFITWYHCATLADAKEIVGKANCDNGGILIDTLHFHRSKIGLNELLDVPREWLHYVHVCDAPGQISNTTEGLIHTARQERLYLGEGEIDIKSIISHMPEIPYSLEIPHSDLVREIGYEEHARRCLQKAKDYFA